MRSGILKTMIAVAATFGVVAAASAADLAVKGPVYAKAPVIEPVATWTGFYVGVIGGYATGPVHVDPAGILPLIGAYPIDFTAKGGFAGGQIGYDRQFDNGLVLGVVGDISWAHLTGSACAEVTPGHCTGAPRDSYASGTVDWLATVRAKAGVALSPQWLLYATGGAAFAGAKGEDTFIDGTNTVTATATHTGWTVGAGAEYRITRQLSFGVEYLYADLGTRNYAFNSSGLLGPLNGQPISIDANVKLNIIKAALNLHF